MTKYKFITGGRTLKEVITNEGRTGETIVALFEFSANKAITINPGGIMYMVSFVLFRKSYLLSVPSFEFPLEPTNSR